jgi:hypothetical protein
VTARLYCWEPELGLDPDNPDLNEKVGILLGGAHFFEPSPGILRFVDAIQDRLAAQGIEQKSVWQGRSNPRVAARLVVIDVRLSVFDLVRPIVESEAKARGIICREPSPVFH